MPSQLTVRLPEKLDEQISSLAQRLHLKRSDIVRLALTQFVEQSIDTTSPERPYDRVKHLLGSIDSGEPDLGEQHRQHLLQRFKQHA